jgi:hypothetical protein
MSRALRVNNRHKVNFYPPAEGQQNGAGNASPLRFLQQGRAGLCFLFLLSLRGVCSVGLSLRGLFGGDFPLTPPSPLAVK